MDNLEAVQVQTLVYDFANKLRLKSSTIRGTQHAFLDFGGAAAVQTIFTVPVGAARCRIIAFELNNINGETGLLMTDVAAQVFPTIDVAANTQFNRSLDQLGGGIIVTTNLRVTPSANNCTFWCSYIVEYDDTDF